MDARSAREWSSEAAARAICPNSLRRRCYISEETGGWLVCDRTDTSNVCSNGTRRIRLKLNLLFAGLKFCMRVCDKNRKEWTNLKSSRLLPGEVGCISFFPRELTVSLGMLFKMQF